MLVVVRTVDRLSVAKETPVLQAVKRMDWLWQQCMVLHFTHCLNGSDCAVLPLYMKQALGILRA